jgi:hypothetical protein
MSLFHRQGSAGLSALAYYALPTAPVELCRAPVLPVGLDPQSPERSNALPQVQFSRSPTPSIFLLDVTVRDPPMDPSSIIPSFVQHFVVIRYICSGPPVPGALPPRGSNGPLIGRPASIIPPIADASDSFPAIAARRSSETS